MENLLRKYRKKKIEERWKIFEKYKKKKNFEKNK